VVVGLCDLLRADHDRTAPVRLLALTGLAGVALIYVA